MALTETLQIATKDKEQATDSCFHCGLPIPNNSKFEQDIGGLTRQFCCPACQMVCHAIYDANLDGFYQRTLEKTKLAPPPEAIKDPALYDLDDVQAEFVAELGRIREIRLLVEGIHCAACVWLIEKSLAQTIGILDARVNLSSKKLLLRWDNQKVKLSQIINSLGNIGYAAIPYDPQVAENKLNRQNRKLLLRMAFAGFAMMNLLWISIALYSGADKGEFRNLFHWVGFALATPTLLYSGFPFLHSAWTGLKHRQLTMDLPIAIGAASTYVYSVFITVSQSTTGEVYYDTVVNFLFVILVGRYLEAMSKRQAVISTQRLLDLQARGATVLYDGEESLVPIRAVKPNDTVLIRPGALIPVDGVVIEGGSSVDESMLSGESRPVRKNIQDQVHAGTLNTDSVLKVLVTATLQNTSLGRIIDLVEQAQASKAPIQCVADRIVPWFVAVTLLLAILSFSWWIQTSFELALMTATAVLIITCPCAFGLATPMAIASAAGLGASRGILIKNGEVLESLSQINHFVFDKTGTLTKGHMQVQSVVTVDGVDEKSVVAFAAALETYSEHSLAKAIVTWAKKIQQQLLTAKQVQSKPGLGVKGKVGITDVVVGSSSWLARNQIACNPHLLSIESNWESKGQTCIHVALDGREAGLIVVADELREDAKPLINALQLRGIRMTLLSGDKHGVVEFVAQQLGGMEIIAEVLPEDKDRVIAKFQQNGNRIAMVGDGVNDAPALARSDVGIALASGTEVSGESADIVLMNDELHKVHMAIDLSERTLKTIRQNIGISIVYNIIMVPLAMAAFITPLVAAIAMPISSLLVIGNAARIRTVFKNK